MKTLWALVANASFAQIYEIKGHGREIQKIHQLDNPDGRKRSGEILTDKPGRTYESMGKVGKMSTGSHNYGSMVDPKEHELQLFMHKILEILKKARSEKSYEELAIIAPPHVLGEFNRLAPEAVKKLVIKEVGRDLPLTIHEQERIDHLSDYLDLFNRKH